MQRGLLQDGFVLSGLDRAAHLGEDRHALVGELTARAGAPAEQRLDLADAGPAVRAGLEADAIWRGVQAPSSACFFTCCSVIPKQLQTYTRFTSRRMDGALPSR